MITNDFIATYNGEAYWFQTLAFGEVLLINFGKELNMGRMVMSVKLKEVLCH
jgi:hypothetical protein